MSENFRFAAYAGGAAGFFCSARKIRARMPTTIPTMTIPMRIGRRLDSCRSVVGFTFGWIRPSMAGLYYLVRSQVSGLGCQESQALVQVAYGDGPKRRGRA